MFYKQLPFTVTV